MTTRKDRCLVCGRATHYVARRFAWVHDTPTTDGIHPNHGPIPVAALKARSLDSRNPQAITRPAGTGGMVAGGSGSSSTKGTQRSPGGYDHTRASGRPTETPDSTED